ncbi:uncharacterized protein LOC132203994 [Neocloeon triangulifer]|uniref:uncharacterized protein LOC132203994 n=1 Tax=Neocloeon triangulifer TaxID=2078957 RepID=UPI00286EBBD6|nr:uncharacterized protein LOC132203994 [Neocloeon triangulifer]
MAGSGASISLALLALLLANSVQHEHNQMQTAYVTDTGEMCITACAWLSSYYYCWKGWGSSKGGYCTPSGESKVQLPISQRKGRKQKPCTGLCTRVDSAYNWCFTGDAGENNYCTPDPIPLGTLNKIHDKMRSYPTCNERKKRGFGEGIMRNFGVGDVIDTLRALLPGGVRHVSSVDNPIIEYLVWPAPPVANMEDNVPLTYFIRARITPRHRARREPIPSMINRRMTNMNAEVGDERGHLLAASLGGPTVDFNFAPQSRLVNRNAGDGLSCWFALEQEIRSFLDGNPNSYVDWNLTISYGNLRVTRRPTAFSIRTRFYNNGVMVRESGDMVFDNNGGNPM